MFIVKHAEKNEPKKTGKLQSTYQSHLGNSSVFALRSKHLCAYQTVQPLGVLKLQGLSPRSQDAVGKPKEKLRTLLPVTPTMTCQDITFILTFYLIYILAFYLTDILGYYLTYILAFYVTSIPTFYVTYIPTFYLAFYLTKF